MEREKIFEHHRVAFVDDDDCLCQSIKLFFNLHLVSDSFIGAAFEDFITFVLLLVAVQKSLVFEHNDDVRLCFRLKHVCQCGMHSALASSSGNYEDLLSLLLVVEKSYRNDGSLVVV